MNDSDRSLSRRTMLCRCVQAAAFAGAANRCGPLFAGAGSRWFKIGACEWSLGKADPSCFEVAKQIGLDGVQVAMGGLSNDMQLRKPEVQKAYLEAAKKTGLEMASVAISELNRVPLKSDPRAAVWLAESIGVCKALGVRIVMPAFFGRGELDMSNAQEIDHVVEVIRGVAPQAEKEGISIALENTLSAEDNLKIIERIGSPALKVYYDVGNSTAKGRDIFKEIRLLGKMICEFHAKDGRSMLGQGQIDFKAVRKAIDEIQYSGWIQLEAAKPHGLIEDYTADHKFLRALFPERG